MKRKATGKALKAASTGRSKGPSKARKVSAEVVDTNEPALGGQPNDFHNSAPGNEEHREQSEHTFAAAEVLPTDERLEPGDFDSISLPTEGLRVIDLPEVARLTAARQDQADSSLVPAVSDPVTLYLAEIQKYPLLTREEEHKLAVRYKESGDPAAAQALVTSNLRFVVKIAAEYAKYAKGGGKLIDLIQEGNVGLMHGVREFDPYKGVRLITYAVWWIRGYIQEFLMRQYSIVRIGTTQAQRRLFYRLEKEKERLQLNGTEATAEVLAENLGVTVDEVESMTMRLKSRDLSLNQPVDEENKSTLLDREATADEPLDDQLAQAELVDLLREQIEAIKSDLNQRELELLEDRLLADEPLTLQEIGEKYGVTREAVRQMESRLMAKIKASLLKRLHSSSL